MKLNIVDPVGNFGGGSRFLRCLAPALKRRRPTLQIRILAPRSLFVREEWEDCTGQQPYELVELRSTRLSNEGFFGRQSTAPAIRYSQGLLADKLRMLPGILSGDAQREIQKKCADADAILYPWPYLFALPDISAPAAAVFHDFNFRYAFGGFSPFFPWQKERIHREMPNWIAGTFPVVTSDFMAEELARFYPDCGKKPDVIRIPPMLPPCKHPKLSKEDLFSRFEISEPYILYPCNLHTHKNIGALIAATAQLDQEDRPVSLVLTGPYTEQIRGEANKAGAVCPGGKGNVHGLGYVSTAEMEALISFAAVVLSCSLYEAGNGPGIEAWAKARPVAMSNIPSFLEHIRVWGVHAEIFDPHSIDEMTRAIDVVLTDPEKALALARQSRERIQELNWDVVADQYLVLFDRMTQE